MLKAGNNLISFDILSSLPDEILKLILQFIANDNQIFINASLYQKYHYLIYDKYELYLKKLEQYIKFILRNDLNVIMRQVLREKIRIWSVYFYHNKKKIYKKKIFYKYLDFIKELSNEYESNKCKEEINKSYRENKIKYGKCKNFNHVIQIS